MRVCSILLVWMRRLCSSGGRGLWLANDKLWPAEALLDEVMAAADNNDEDDDVATEAALVAVADVQAIEVAIALTSQSSSSLASARIQHT